MYAVDDRFHGCAIRDGVKSRCRIYFIDDSVDCTDDSDVQQNGTLITRYATDSDSNKRISGQGGIVFSDVFNTDNNIQIGKTVSKPITLNLLNNENTLNDFAFGRCKIYLDVYCDDDGEWLSCPMGVYIIDIPVKRNLQVVTATGYDQMQYLNEIADAWWNDIDWTGGKTLLQLIQDLATAAGVHISTELGGHVLNGSKSYSKAPFKSSQKTFRDIAAWLAGATGTIAYFDRDGALDFKWFSWAQINGQNVAIDGSSVGNQCFAVDVADYAVTPVDMLHVMAVEPELSATVGTGSNIFNIAGNPFYTGADVSEVVGMATPVFGRLSGIDAYNPSSARAIMDWSLESGDMVVLNYNGNAIPVLIMQQNMTWRGGNVVSDFLSGGEANRPTQTEAERSAYRNELTIHEFENTAAQLRSMISDLSGNYTLINQTVNSIAQTVSGQGNTIQDILDPNGEIWSAIKTNSTDLGNLEDALNQEVSYRQSYIRFIPAEPAIVLGVDEDNEIKLKLVNNVIYFFNGDDDSTDLSLAYAYFNSEEAGAERFVATESVQIGKDTSPARWIFKELANGDLVLDFV